MLTNELAAFFRISEDLLKCNDSNVSVRHELVYYFHCSIISLDNSLLILKVMAQKKTVLTILTDSH